MLKKTNKLNGNTPNAKKSAPAIITRIDWIHSQGSQVNFWQHQDGAVRAISIHSICLLKRKISHFVRLKIE